MNNINILKFILFYNSNTSIVMIDGVKKLLTTERPTIPSK